MDDWDAFACLSTVGVLRIHGLNGGKNEDLISERIEDKSLDQ